MPDGVMATISHFDCDVPGSNPGLATAERITAYRSMEEYCATNTEIKVRLFLSRQNM